MKKTAIGQTGIEVPPLCIGTMGFCENPACARGWSLDYETSRQIVEAAIRSGLNFFDTTPVRRLFHSAHPEAAGLKTAFRRFPISQTAGKLKRDGAFHPLKT